MTPDAAEPVGREPESLAGPSAGPSTDQPPEETAQSELDLGVVSTGSADVDRALRPLDGLAERPVADHAEIFDQVLGELAETMTGTDGAPDGAPIEPPATA